MARTCDICQRSTTVSISRSHSNIASKRRKYVNLQKRKINGKRMTLCTNCLKSAVKKQSN